MGKKGGKTKGLDGLELAHQSEDFMSQESPPQREGIYSEDSSIQSDERSLKHIWLRQTPFHMEMGLPTPPGWYLYLVIAFQIITAIMDPLIYEGHPPMLLATIMRYVAYLWFGLNLAIIWLLYSHQAQRSAYILPVYYLVLFFVLISFGVILSYGKVSMSTTQMTDVSYWLLIVTTLIETSIALIQLRMRRMHARR